MGGFGGALAGLSALDQTLNAKQKGVREAGQASSALDLALAKAQRDQQMSQLDMTLKGAHANEANAHADSLRNPKKKYTHVPVTVNGKGVMAMQDEEGNLVDPKTKQPLSGDITPFVPPKESAPHYTPVTVAGSTPDAPAEVRPFNTKTGQVGTPVGNAKQTLHIDSATNTAAKARLEAAVSEMNNAHEGMAAYEQKLASGQASINGLEQVVGRAGAAFTHDDPVSMAIQSTTLSALNKTNPELARYIRRALSFAEGESMISQRPSDFRTKMSAFLSQAASGASPEMIHDIQSRRTAILNPLNNTVKPSQPAGGKAGKVPVSSGNIDLGAPSRAQQLWDAAVAKHGEAKVLQEYGPRPDE